MIMPLRVPRLALTLHVAASVGWVGAVLGFLALAHIGLTGPSASTVPAVCLVMEPAARRVLVPLAIATLLTGIVQSLDTSWGLFRH